MSARNKEKTFRHTLLPNLHLDDNAWDFTVPNLPSPSALRQAGLIKTVRLHTDPRKHYMVLEVEQSNANRAIENVPLDRFILLSLEGFRPLSRGALAREPSLATDLRPRTAKDVSDYSIKVLRAGIAINDVRYNFYGHSNSQLKSRSCFLMAAPKKEISERVEALGDFSKMKTVGKKAKRIGLLFSSAKTAMVIPPDSRGHS